jgi:hypothetical protein
MNEITCTIKELFDSVSDINNIKYEIDEFYNQPNKIQIPDEFGKWADVVSLITKRDKIRTIKFDSGDVIKVADRHLISNDGVNCVMAHELGYSDMIRKSNGNDIFVISNEVSPDEHTVYDITVDTPTHLFQTENGIIHHNTMAAKALVRALNRPDFYFNLGSTQDARASLIGNTHFDSKKGTFFSESAFVKAITTENAVILLDELSRAHPDAWNILMTVLDEGQRYLRLDEADGSPIVKVASGVTFIATANIGNEYTSTRVMDRAILDRFTTIEMEVLNDVQEFDLLKHIFPKVDSYNLKAVAEIANHTREMCLGGSGKLSNMVSTRASVETAGLIYDGFSLIEAAQISILPFFANDGGVESERTYVLQLVQKYVKNDKVEDKLFNVSVETDSTVEW